LFCTSRLRAASRQVQWQRVCHARVAAPPIVRKCRTVARLAPDRAGRRRAARRGAAAGAARQFRIRCRDFRDPPAVCAAACARVPPIYLRSARGTSIAIGSRAPCNGNREL